MMRVVLAACVLVSTTAATMFFGAEAAPEPDRLQAALALQQVLGGDAAVTKTITGLRPALINMMVQTNHVAIGTAAQMIDQVLMPDLKAHQAEIEAAKARIFAEHFTVAELAAIRIFYLSPTGQKFLAQQPAMAMEAVKAMQPFLRDVTAHAAALAKKDQTGTTPQ